MKPTLFVTALLLLICSLTADAEPTDYRLVDLTHSYNEKTLYWPTSPSRFEMKTLAEGETEGGWYYSAYSVCTPEHGGTHLDAPIHFSASGLSVENLPLENLLAPAVVIDIAEQSAGDRNYRLTIADIEAFEANNGRIKPGTIVLLRTGWSQHWPDALRYLGDDTRGDATKLSFPSYGEDAARLLVEQRGAAILGVDTASIDYGQSSDFPVHRVAAAKNVAGLENLTNLGSLPRAGFYVVALPVKIEGGSGGPVRVVAMVPR